MDVEQVKKYVPADQLKQDLLVNKAIDLVKTTAVVTEKAAEAE